MIKLEEAKRLDQFPRTSWRYMKFPVGTPIPGWGIGLGTNEEVAKNWVQSFYKGPNYTPNPSSYKDYALYKPGYKAKETTTCFCVLIENNEWGEYSL